MIIVIVGPVVGVVGPVVDGFPGDTATDSRLPSRTTADACLPSNARSPGTCGATTDTRLTSG
ncbi:MAG: hypothetical protein ACREO9_04835, partial [Lysobacterales bacterium]